MCCIKLHTGKQEGNCQPWVVIEASFKLKCGLQEGTLTGVDAIEAEANQLKVESLQEELASLKEMYSRQFVASKKELDAAQNRIRQLRREILRPHNGVQPRSDGVAEPETGGASDPSAKPHGTVPDSDVSLWASELITKVSRSPPGVHHPVLDLLAT